MSKRKKNVWTKKLSSREHIVRDEKKPLKNKFMNKFSAEKGKQKIIQLNQKLSPKVKNCEKNPN